ncbi:MAG: hypothetical protein BWY06_02796 [Candidatus Latescibacteria bacterium ADurb.Bin168]|nr:MAG: hypothetical protein BWY06_02796 [Candidatus Latescibacteria bacterium ADurb.Bin168]
MTRFLRIQGEFPPASGVQRQPFRRRISKAAVRFSKCGRGDLVHRVRINHNPQPHPGGKRAGLRNPPDTVRRATACPMERVVRCGVQYGSFPDGRQRNELPQARGFKRRELHPNAHRTGDREAFVGNVRPDRMHNDPHQMCAVGFAGRFKRYEVRSHVLRGIRLRADLEHPAVSQPVLSELVRRHGTEQPGPRLPFSRHCCGRRLRPIGNRDQRTCLRNGWRAGFAVRRAILKHRLESTLPRHNHRVNPHHGRRPLRHHA